MGFFAMFLQVYKFFFCNNTKVKLEKLSETAFGRHESHEEWTLNVPTVIWLPLRHCRQQEIFWCTILPFASEFWH